jgi:DNA gyrase subunit A
MAVRFLETDVLAKSRDTQGVRAIRLDEGDYVIAAEVFEQEQGLILSISENGFGKRTPLKDYRLTGRGGKGVINMKTTPRVGKVMNVLSVKEDTELMIITQNGKMIRIDSANIRKAGRSTQGVKLVSLDEGDRVAAASCIPEDSPSNGKNGETVQ